MEEPHKDEILEQDSLISIPSALSQGGVMEQDAVIHIPEPLLFKLNREENLVQPAADCGWCEVLCQELCEHNAECSCQAVCQSSQCGSCQSNCQTTCQDECQTNCELSCQYACEDTCEVGCQVSCQTVCESAAQRPKVRASVSITNIAAYSATVRITINDATDISLEVLDTSTNNYVYDGDFSIVRPVTTIELTDLTPNTDYSYYIWDDVGGNSTTYVFTTLSDRPDNWEWWSDVGTGEPISLSANEWNAFCDRINKFREYKDLPQYGAFVHVSRGDTITAATVNHTVWAIGAMKSSALQYEVSPGDTITASFFNGLKNALNSL